MDADAPMPTLSLAGLETLLAALDPLLDGFGAGPSCLDDALAFLARLASGGTAENGEDHALETGVMMEWIERWRAAGGNRETLRLLVRTVMAERGGPASAEDAPPAT